MTIIKTRNAVHKIYEIEAMLPAESVVRSKMSDKDIDHLLLELELKSEDPSTWKFLENLLQWS